MVELTCERGVTVHLDEPVEGTCISCDRRRDVTPIHVVQPRSGAVDSLHVCGTCLVGALAVRLTAQMIDEGALRLADLIEGPTR